MNSLKTWWEEDSVKGNVGYFFHIMLKHLKTKIKNWVSININKVEKKN